MIQIEDLTRVYADIIAVNHISLTIPGNGVLGFLGPNGAGKSTAMNIIAGYISATSGRVLVGEWDILLDPTEARMQIGYLPELPPLYRDFTVWEYLSFAFGLKRCRMDRTAHLEDICRDTGLTQVKRRLIKNLSKGYQQRVGIAQALVGNPPILILDEPTVGLDPAQIIEMRGLIRRLGETHTVILSSHILPEVQLVCDRIVVMNRGVIVLDGAAEELSRAASGGRQYSALIRGPQMRVLDAVGAVSGVQTVRPSGEGYLICAAKGADIREALFYALAERGLPLVGLCESRTSLEELFMQLVEDKAPQGAKEEAGRV